MDAFIKTFDDKTFFEKINELKPSCLMMGEDAFEALRKKNNNKLMIDYSKGPKDDGLVGTFSGTKIFLVSNYSFPTDKIIFGVE